MINWKEMESLHVISKMEEILSKWYGLELIWVDKNGKVSSRQLEKDHNFKSKFMSSQVKMDYGAGYLDQDIEKVADEFKDTENTQYEYSSFFKHVKGMSSKVVIDGEYLGQIMAYPYRYYDMSDKEAKELKAQMVECGLSSEEANESYDSLKTMGPRDLEYFKDLVDLIGAEISGFHEEISKRETRIQELNSELGDKYRYHMMIGKSKPMQKIYRLLEKVSNSDTSVFIQGENGTGKELVAKAVHFYSPRKENMFLAVNCSAFNDNLLDSELFGHVKGSFTGAIKDKKGLFEQANGGTLFLDEIGDTSLAMQVKLLRVLQEGTYLPVGGATPKKCNVRIIAATNKNIKKMMETGEFREDLYYRINVINVDLPPLRDRREDISILMDTFLKRRCDERGVPMKTFSKKCVEYLFDYKWPGNVRELENEIERLVVLAGDDKVIVPDSLSTRIQDSFGGQSSWRPQSASASGAKNIGINTSGTLKAALEELEALMIGEGLKRCQYNKSKLAKELGVSRASLIMKVDKYDLDKRKKAANE